MNEWRLMIFGGILVLLVPLIIAGCAQPAGPSGGTVPPATFTSNGQRIYFTATSNSGDPIVSEGFTMMMHRIACADCHGADGRGGTVYMMMQQFDVPNITWAHLTGPHEDHPPYTVETVKQAITRGVDPAGNQLDEFMPRWQMSPADLNDLINYLQTLK